MINFVAESVLQQLNLPADRITVYRGSSLASAQLAMSNHLLKLARDKHADGHYLYEAAAGLMSFANPTVSVSLDGRVYRIRMVGERNQSAKRKVSDV